MSDYEDVKCGWKTRADELSTSLMLVAQERDAAKADAARLREGFAAFLEVSRCSNGCPPDDMTCATARADAALSATDSAEWLAKHDAEVIEKATGLLRETVKALDAARAEALVMSSDCHDSSCQACARCFDAARADAARLREALETCVEQQDTCACLEDEGCDYCDEAIAETRAALAATDSAEWLEKHDAEVTAPLRARIAELEEVGKKVCKDNSTLEGLAYVGEERNDYTTWKERAKSLEAQLAAATNDAARAELRAKDAVARITKLSLLKEMDSVSPDSDARLREVMLRVAEWVHEVVLSAPEPVIKSELPEIVDEVLGVKP